MKCLALLLCLLPFYGAAQTIYTWVDEDGITHFSDEPHRGAQEVKLSPQPPSGDKPPRQQTRPVDRDQSQATPQANEQVATGVSIKSPSNEETLPNNMGNVPVDVLLTGGKLGKDQSLQLVLDDQPTMAPQKSLNWLLNNLPRGEHILMVQLLKNGKVMATSQSIKVFVHRPIIRRKN